MSGGASLSHPPATPASTARLTPELLTPGLLRLVLASLVVFGLEAGLLAGTVLAGLATGPALAGHVLICATLAVMARPDATGAMDTDLAGLAVWTLLAGPFGPLLAAAVSMARHAAPSDTLEERFDDLLEGQPGDPATLHIGELCDALDDGRLGTDAPEGLDPLLDAIEHGSQAEALAALRAVSMHFGPDLAPVVRRAAVSEDAAVRVLAATVLADLKKHYSDRVSAARRILDEDPGHHPARQALFEACMDYANSGLLSADLAGEMRRMAFACSDGLHTVDTHKADPT